MNHDVDAICAAKILQYILRFDNIVYVLVPVKTITELKQVFDEQKVDVNNYKLFIPASFILVIMSLLNYKTYV